MKTKAWIRKGRRVRIELLDPATTSHPAMLRPFVVRGLKREPLPRRASSRTVHLAGIVASAFSSATIKTPTAGVGAPATGLGNSEGTQVNDLVGAGGAGTADAPHRVSCAPCVTRRVRGLNTQIYIYVYMYVNIFAALRTRGQWLLEGEANKKQYVRRKIENAL